MENKKEEYCPICNTIVTNINRSPAEINNESICRSCMRAINKINQIKKISKKTNLDDLKRMVENEKKSTVISSIIAIVLLLLIGLFIVWLFSGLFTGDNGGEYECQTEMECAQEKIWEAASKSDN